MSSLKNAEERNYKLKKVENVASSAGYILFISNFILALGGLVLVLIGGVVVTKMKLVTDLTEDQKYIAPDIGYIILGCIVFAVSFFGCFTFHKRIPSILIWYGLVLLSVLIAEIAIYSLGFLFRIHLDNSLENYLLRTFDGNKVLADVVRLTFQCCGVRGPPADQFPSSCCGGKEGVCSATGAFDKSCFDNVRYFIAWSNDALGDIVVGMAAIELVSAVISFYLAHLLLVRAKLKAMKFV